MRTSLAGAAFGATISSVLIASMLAAACGESPTRPTSVVTHPAVAPAARSADVPASNVQGRDVRRLDLNACLQGLSSSCFDATGVSPSTVSRALAPGAPGNLTATVSGNVVSLSWTASPDAADYVIQVGTTPGASDLVNGFLYSLSTTYSGTANAGTYYIRVLAWSGAYSLPSNEVTVVVGGCAAAPRNLRNLVDPSDANPTATVWLQWDAPASGVATSYVIEAGSAPGRGDLLNLETGDTSTYYLAQGVARGTYFVRLRARSACGLSGASNEIIVTIGGSVPAGCPTAPRLLTVSSQSAGTIALAWQAPAVGSARSYLIEAGSAPGLSDLARVDTFSADTRYTVSNVAAGSYYVRVKAAGACGFTAASNEVLVYVIAVSGDVQVSVSWDTASDIDLHVVDPSGEEVYWGNPSSRSGGQLLVDSNSACTIDGRQIENIKWAGTAPGGVYTVRVDYWSSCGVAQTNYTVTVKNGASTQTFTGTFTGTGDRGGRGSGRTVTTFSHASSTTTGPSREGPAPAPVVVVAPAKRALSVDY